MRTRTLPLNPQTQVANLQLDAGFSRFTAFCAKIGAKLDGDGNVLYCLPAQVSDDEGDQDPRQVHQAGFIGGLGIDLDHDRKTVGRSSGSQQRVPSSMSD